MSRVNPWDAKAADVGGRTCYVDISLVSCQGRGGGSGYVGRERPSALAAGPGHSWAMRRRARACTLHTEHCTLNTAHDSHPFRLIVQRRYRNMTAHGDGHAVTLHSPPMYAPEAASNGMTSSEPTRCAHATASDLTAGRACADCHKPWVMS